MQSLEGSEEKYESLIPNKPADLKKVEASTEKKKEENIGSKHSLNMDTPMPPSHGDYQRLYK